MFFKIKEILDKLGTPLFLLRGRKPWTLGYYTAKKTAICQAIDSGLPSEKKDYPEKFGVQIDERIVEYPWVFSQLPAEPGMVLDAGSALNHEFLLDRAPLNKAQLSIMTLAPEKRCFWKKSISYVFGDLRLPYFNAAAFDVVVSVSTIEHIGLDNTLLYTGDSTKREFDDLGFLPAVKEFRRVLKPGGMCLITVPFGRRGVHGWYQVFDLEAVSEVIKAFDPTEHTLDFFGYGESGWNHCEHEDIIDAEFFDVHEGGDFAPDYAAGARGVACLKLIA